MRILCLYGNNCALELFKWLENQGHVIFLCKERLDKDWCEEQNFDLTISYTYRYILTEEIITALKNNVVNIHNSLLPWNRGADPNLWSIIEETPRGVTLHYVDTGLDKGFIIAQELVQDINDKETLSSTYNNLDRAAKSLFKRAFSVYDFWPSLKKQCIGKGSYHSLSDGEKIKALINSYNLSVAEYKKKLAPQTVRKLVSTAINTYLQLLFYMWEVAA